jgi:hypothetical protein
MLLASTTFLITDLSLRLIGLGVSGGISVLDISYCASKRLGAAHLASPDTAHDLSLGRLIA